MKCSKCNRTGNLIELKYEKKFLCSQCFLRLFEKRVRRTIRLNKLLKPDDKTAVALSGGKDSSTVLYILKKHSEKIRKSELVAITIDQGIGKYQKKCLKAAEGLCSDLGIENHVYSFEEEFGITLDELVRKSKNLESTALPCTYCGILRRKLINERARELGITKIATGHNLDDEIQASLMNYIRGDLDRIARMGAIVGVIKDKKFIPRIKPLRECPENEVLRYATLRSLNFAKGKCPYPKEAFRQTVRNVIDKIEENHPGSKFQLLRSTDRLIQIFRERVEISKLKKCRICMEPSSSEICKFCQIRGEFGLQ